MVEYSTIDMILSSFFKINKGLGKLNIAGGQLRTASIDIYD